MSKYINKEKIQKCLDDKDYFYKRGHIVWANLPNQDGSIQKGERKVLIYSNDVNNICSSVLHIIPLTTKDKNFKLHLKRNNARDFYCSEQLQIINKSDIIKERGFELADSSQLEKINDLIDVQLGRKDWREVRI